MFWYNLINALENNYNKFWKIFKNSRNIVKLLKKLNYKLATILQCKKILKRVFTKLVN